MLYIVCAMFTYRHLTLTWYQCLNYVLIIIFRFFKLKQTLIILISIYLLIAVMLLVPVRSWECEWEISLLLQQERMLSSNVSMLPAQGLLIWVCWWSSQTTLWQALSCNAKLAEVSFSLPVILPLQRCTAQTPVWGLLFSWAPPLQSTTDCVHRLRGFSLTEINTEGCGVASWMA